MPTPYHINIHTHCFTLAHVPEEFFNSLIGGNRFLRVSKLRRASVNSFIVWLFTRSVTIGLVGWFSDSAAKQLSRLKGLLKFRKVNTQVALLENLKKNYEEWLPDSNFKFVPLAMDMEYMEAGMPDRIYPKQLAELKQIKDFGKITPIEIQPIKQMLNWKGTPGEFGCIMKELIDKGYLPLIKDLKNTVGILNDAFEIKNLEVAFSHQFKIGPSAAVVRAPLYLYPFLQLAEATLAVNLSGIAIHFMDLCENVFDEKYSEINGFTTRGRGIYVTLRYRESCQCRRRERLLPR